MGSVNRQSGHSLDLPVRTNSFREGEEGTKWSEDCDSKETLNEPRTVPPRTGAVRSMSSGGEQVQQQAGEYWRTVTDSLNKSAKVGQQFFNAGLVRASAMVGKDPAAVKEALRKSWSRAIEVSSRLWEKAKPRLMNYMPEDRSPLWVCSVVVLVVCLAIAGLKTDIKHAGSSKKVEMLPITAQRIQLPDGRYIAYCEQGVATDMARHSILVVHGFPSSRLAGIPGIKEELLQEFGVRLITYDRPGFGQSDPHPRWNLRTSAQDMAYIASALGMGDKFWVLGYSHGGIHAWAAVKYIPEKLEGVAMFAPGGNLYAPNMTKEEINKAWGVFTLRRKLAYIIARRAPSLLPSFYQRTLLQKIDKYSSSLAATLAKKDQAIMEQEFFMEAFDRDIRESVRQRNAVTLAEEVIMQVTDWGFHLSDLYIRKKPSKPSGFIQWVKGFFEKVEEDWEGFTGPIHIWQGTDDRLVPLALNEFAYRMVPQANLHKLEGEGHFSYFCFCDNCHREIFETLFGIPEGSIDMAAAAQPLLNV